MKDNILTVLIAVAAAILVTALSISITGKDDTPLEEFAEDVLKLETGIDIKPLVRSFESSAATDNVSQKS